MSEELSLLPAIPIEIWSVILSQFSDAKSTCTDTSQLRSIMTMSLTNTIFKNIIKCNSFWVLFQNLNYSGVSLSIYESTNVLLEIAETLKKFTNKSLSEYRTISTYNTIPIMSYKSNYLHINKPSYFEIPTEYQNLVCCRYTENDLCILFEGKERGTHKKSGFIYKKYLPNDIPFIDKCYPIKEFEENELIDYEKVPKLFCSNDRFIICDDYILFVQYIFFEDMYKLNFYAQSILTNIKYILHEIIVFQKYELQTKRPFDLYLENDCSTLYLYLYFN